MVQRHRAARASAPRQLPGQRMRRLGHGACRRARRGRRVRRALQAGHQAEGLLVAQRHARVQLPVRGRQRQARRLAQQPDLLRGARGPFSITFFLCLLDLSVGSQASLARSQRLK